MCNPGRVPERGGPGWRGTKGQGAAGIFAGFVPWILYWSLSGPGLWTAAVTGALLAALLLAAWRLRRRSLKVMEVITLAFFTSHFAVTVVAGSDLFKRYDAVLPSAVLAIMAWGTLLAGSPFTYQYARDDWPREYWSNALFRKTNAIITAVWGAIFLLNTVLGALSLVRPEDRTWLVVVVPNAVIGLGVAFSLLFPSGYPRWVLARTLALQEPYRWPNPDFGAARPLRPDQHDVIVVGAGIGGLTAAALLARRGLKVLVLEQHYLAGGYCTSWSRVVRRGAERLRYVFDAGVHDVSGLGPRGPVRRLLQQLGIEGRLDWRRVGHEYVLPGLRLKIPVDAAEFARILADRFPAERDGIAAFFAEMEAVYQELYADVDRTGGVPRPPRTVDELLAYPLEHPHAFRWMDVPFGKMLDAHFRDPLLKRFLSVLTGYLTDNPAELTAAAMAPIFGYYFDGGYYPAGGSQALADSLVRVVEEHGGRVLLRTPVRRIRVEDGRVAGVELATGEFHRARAVVSNADVRRTFLELVGREHLPADFVRRVEGLRPSTSAFAVFLGVDYVPDIEPITVAAMERGVAIAVPSRVDPSLAPPGHSAITLLTLIPQSEAASWDRTLPGYTRRKRAFADELIALAESVLPGLRDHIVYRQEASPATFARYTWATGGAIYGPAIGPWRPSARSPVAGLVLAGSGVFPGAGVEAVVISGTIAADTLCPVGPGRRSTACLAGLRQGA